MRAVLFVVWMGWLFGDVEGSSMTAHMSRYTQSGCDEFGDQEYALQVWLSTDADGYASTSDSGCLLNVADSVDKSGTWATKTADGATNLRVLVKAFEEDA
eukprot:Hpha_TRINITY_DN15714_c0_g7::TRINITY_DN15714_c0_g7_i1::g.36479::m.36479